MHNSAAGKLCSGCILSYFFPQNDNFLCPLICLLCACPFPLCCQALYHIQTESPSPPASLFPPLPFSLIPLTFVRAVLQSSSVPRVHQNSHQADYALYLSTSLCSLFVWTTLRGLRLIPFCWQLCHLLKPFAHCFTRHLVQYSPRKHQKVTHLISFRNTL